MQKSAKDIAFDKERTKFRKQIKELNSEIEKLKQKNMELETIISNQELLIHEKDDWIQRLLEYTELTKEDLEKLKNQINEKDHISEAFNGILLFSDLMRKQMYK